MVASIETTGLHEEEWQVVEHLAQCIDLIEELDGLDKRRFMEGVEQLQEMVMSLPTKRQLVRSG